MIFMTNLKVEIGFSMSKYDIWPQFYSKYDYECQNKIFSHSLNAKINFEYQPQLECINTILNVKI